MVWRNSLSSNVDVAHTRQAPRTVYCLRTKYEASIYSMDRDEMRIIKRMGAYAWKDGLCYYCSTDMAP
jgi:hypothetical protein